MTEKISTMLEWFAGLMLVLFGLDVLRRVARIRLNFRFHSHQNDAGDLNSNCNKNENGFHDASLCSHARILFGQKKYHSEHLL